MVEEPEEPLTFGVELEFNVAYLRPDEPMPADADAKHTLRIPRNDDVVRYMQAAWAGVDEDVDVIVQECEIWEASVREHIVKTLGDLKINAYSEVTSQSVNTDLWSVIADASVAVEDADKDGYRWTCVELVSPKYDFTPENVLEVKKVCDAIAGKYKYRVNTTTGVHVHVGDGDEGFTLPTMKRLVTFLWAFEPQMSTLHPAKRLDAMYAYSMRNYSELAAEFHLDNGYKLPPAQTMVTLGKAKTYDELLDAASTRYNSRNGYYNWQNILTFFKRDVGKPTIEFRQHEGTLNSARVTTWIKTLVGIVDAVRKLPTAELNSLKRICANETWQKHGDGKDDARERKFGPTVADSTFTIINLLNFLNLNKSAAFYQTRGLYKHEYTQRAEPDLYGLYNDEDGNEQELKTFDLPDFLVSWEFEDDRENFPKGSDQYKRATEKKELWERTVVANKLNKALDPNYVELDTTSNFWPTHTLMPRLPTPPPSEQSTTKEEESVEAESEDAEVKPSFGHAGSASKSIFSARREEPRAGSGNAPRWCDRFVDGRGWRHVPSSSEERPHKRQRT